MSRFIGWVRPAAKEGFGLLVDDGVIGIGVVVALIIGGLAAHFDGGVIPKNLSGLVVYVLVCLAMALSLLRVRRRGRPQ